MQTTTDEQFDLVKKTAEYDRPSTKYSFTEPIVDDSLYDDKKTEGY